MSDIPDLVAFYLANAYSRHCLSECNLINHINSAIDVFNCKCDISRLIPKLKGILRIKYNKRQSNDIKEILIKSRTLSDKTDRVFKCLLIGLGVNLLSSKQ